MLDFTTNPGLTVIDFWVFVTAAVLVGFRWRFQMEFGVDAAKAVFGAVSEKEVSA